ncbi:hypothetical protein COV11_03530 [Candidatus Woesearchaeota archaeon CG10_big_fil_rev_8_21_14_0_10_30_7]|nr:MAG: hypothetical protein COV11_03530 [Candidatus Woesearchaeota archaeon CG10_big_fil_rev_8_21_14_0_10_30_7]
MNLCQKCKQEKELFSKKLCSSCLLIVLEKRIKKSVKEQGGLKREEKIRLLINDSVESKVTEYFLEKIYSNLKLKINIENDEYDKTILPFSSEKIIDAFLKTIFNNELFKQKKQIIFLESLTMEELKDVAEIKKLNGTIKNYELLDKIEKDYPGSKHSLLKSIKILEN